MGQIRKAKWPQHNFTGVVNYCLENPGRENVDILVTVDITNLDSTKQQTTENIKFLQGCVKKSSQNMFRLAEKSLRNNPGLSKVIIMEHPPRFDAPNVDPYSVKPDLAKLANVTLGQLWSKSSLKDRIIIGRHSLESSGVGTAHFSRYQNSVTGRYDGVHLYGQTGCTDYTNSVKTMLMTAQPKPNQSNTGPRVGTAQSKNHTNCAQAKFQRKQYHPSVQVHNRFNVLNQGNF